MNRIEKAKKELLALIGVEKYRAMIETAAVITELLDTTNHKPIIVGGLSVEIYTQSDYSTRDIDFVTWCMMN
jgi:hypothetical protein